MRCKILLFIITILLFIKGMAVSGEIDWVKYPACLDIGDDASVSHPCVLLANNRYHLWYVSQNGAQHSISYAKSTDGVTWETCPSNPVLEDGVGEVWDGELVSQPTVLHDGIQYQMWYTGYDGVNMRIGYATSTNGVDWNKYAGNPVLDLGAGGDFDDTGVSSPVVLYDGSLYYMWYTGYDGVHTRIGYATSIDGVVWHKVGGSLPHAGKPVIDLGNSGDWDDAGVSGPNVLYDGTIYQMWYAGYDGDRMRIGCATSTDGVVWNKVGGLLPHSGNPVLDLGASGDFDDAGVSSPAVLNDGTVSRMFYTGYDGDQLKIGYAIGQKASSAYLTQEINWVKYPVSLDFKTDAHVSHPCLLFAGDRYHAWYVSQTGNQRSINYARSIDGVGWELYPNNPVLEDGVGDVWDGEFVSQPTVLYDGAQYQMWYTGYDKTSMRIGYATSTDGVVWNKYAGGHVLDLGAGGAFDDAGVSSPAVLHDNGLYRMWYTGYDGEYMRIGYATSTDGVVWHKVAGPLPYAGGPVLELGTSGEWDSADVSSPSLLYDGHRYYMFYSGSDGEYIRIGYAISTDGVNWNKSDSNPVLNLGAAGKWDDVGVSCPTVLYDGARYHMLYTGYDGSKQRIGYALGHVPPLESLAITPQDITMYVDEVIDYSAIGTDADGKSWDVTDWSTFTTTGGGTFTDNKFRAKTEGTFTVTVDYLHLTASTTVKIISHGEAVVI
ncbi:MAG: hypothetical protein AAB296_02190, partial [Candidatus Desantisbacteria bacterium]